MPLISTQETTATIVFRLLDRVVAAERIPNAIAKYIAPYMAHHRLDRDTMLLRYIEVIEMEYKLNYNMYRGSQISLGWFYVGGSSILVKYVSANRKYNFKGQQRKKGIILMTDSNLSNMR